MAVDHSTAEINGRGGARVSVEIGKSVLGSQGRDGDPVVLQDTLDVGRELSQLDRAGKDLAACSNGSRSKEGGDALVGVISRKSDSSIGTALVVGKCHGDLLGMTSLEGSRRGRGSEERADSDDRLHFG